MRESKLHLTSIEPLHLRKMNVHDYLLLFEESTVDDEQNLKKSHLIADLVNKKIQLVTIIESLKNVLTDSDFSVRERGVSFLSWILTEIPTDLLNAQEIAAVANFYCDRLKDARLAPATTKGHLALVKMNNIEKESICHILNSLFNEVRVPSYSSRCDLYAIIAHLVDNYSHVVSPMGPDFIIGIISFADGETDPSNLLFLFQLLPTILKNIELGYAMEDMFDFLSGYFPINYNNKSKMASVTRDELAEGLANCLAAQPSFSDNCLAMIVDKLNSSFKIAKVDSYKLLGACCETYPVECINKNSKELWKLIQNDIFLCEDAETKQVALHALSQIVRSFSSSEHDRPLMEDLLSSIIYGLRTLLKGVEDNLFCPSMKILESVSYKSVPAAEFVIENLKFFFDFTALITPNQKRIALSTLKPFLAMMKTSEMSRLNKPEHLSIFNKISEFYLNSSHSNDPEIKKLALSGIRDLVSGFDRSFRVEILEIGAGIIKNGEVDEVRSEIREIFREVAATKPEEFLKFLKKNSEMYPVFAFAIGAAAEVKPVTEYAVPNMIDVITRGGTDFDVGLSSLLDACRNADEPAAFLKTVHEDYMLADKLLAWWIEGTSKDPGKYGACVRNLSEVIALVVRYQQNHVQRSIGNKFVPVLLAGSDISENNVFVIEAIMGSVEPNVTLEHSSSLHKKLVSLAVTSEDEEVRTSSSRLLASFANKASGEVPEWVMKTCEDVFSRLNDSVPVSERLNGIRLLNWIVKGLLLANSHHFEPLVFKWFDLLEKEDVGSAVAEGFCNILKDEDLYLNMGSHCNIKILYRQRFFGYFPALVKRFESSSEACRTNYIAPLVSMVEGVPEHVSDIEMSNIVKLLAQALDVRIPNALFASLSILKRYLKVRGSAFGDHAASFVPKLLKIARYEGYMKIRMDSLRCLYWYGFYPTTRILSLKNEVIASLEPCLNDKKRLVRSEAVRTRNRWFLVGAPGEEDIFL